MSGDSSSDSGPYTLFKWIGNTIAIAICLLIVYWYVTLSVLALFWLYRALKLYSEDEPGPALTRIIWIGFLVTGVWFLSFGGKYAHYHNEWTALGLVIWFLLTCYLLVNLVFFMKSSSSNSYKENHYG